MQPFHIEADTQRGIPRTHFSGVVTAEHLRASAASSADLIAQMRPDFIVVADLSALEEMDIDCVPHITRLMDLFRQAGVARVIRLIPDPSKDIGFTLLSHTHYRGLVPFETLNSASEVEQALAGAWRS